MSSWREIELVLSRFPIASFTHRVSFSRHTTPKILTTSSHLLHGWMKDHSAKNNLEINIVSHTHIPAHLSQTYTQYYTHFHLSLSHTSTYTHTHITHHTILHSITSTSLSQTHTHTDIYTHTILHSLHYPSLSQTHTHIRRTHTHTHTYIYTQIILHSLHYPSISQTHAHTHMHTPSTHNLKLTPLLHKHTHTNEIPSFAPPLSIKIDERKIWFFLLMT